MARQKSQRRLRRSRRGVDVMVATVMMVALVVVLAAVLFILVENYTKSSNTQPTLGAALAIAPPQDAVSKSSQVAACAATACNFYNMTVQTATAGLKLSDLVFELFSENGSLFVPTGGIVVINGTGAVEAQYSFAAEWTSGSMNLLQTHPTIALYTSGAMPQSLYGDDLRVVGMNDYTGSISVHIF